MTPSRKGALSCHQQAVLSFNPACRLMLRLLGGWNGIHALNAFIIVFFLINGTGFGISFSVMQFIKDIQHVSVFPACFQC
jgi:hypothetical protein